tara:strand:- start:76 stop:303 length:228 start_codon:yes stop_codon:yes gene_type:complete
MAGLFGGRSRAPKKTQAQIDAEKAQARSEERATAQERTEMQGAQARRRLRRTGGMRLLFSPERQEGMKTKLGGGQ